MQAKHGRMSALIAVLALASQAAAAGEWQVKVSAEESSGVARKAEPISGGIPLPPGVFKKGQFFTLFKKGGAELPCQAAPLSVRPDGSIRWALLDFQDDLTANGVNQYTLKVADKAGAQPATPLKVSSGAEGVSVDTGKIRFTVAKGKPFTLFSLVEAAGQKVTEGGGVSYTDAFDGKTYSAGTPSSIEIEHLGPMRVTVVVKGRFAGDDRNKFLYAARITAWAGQSSVQVKYTLCNSNEGHYCYRALKASTIRLQLAGKPSATILGAAEPIEAGAEGWILQGHLPRAAGASKTSTGWTSAAGQEAGGWIAARTGAGLVFACDNYFTADPARRLAVEGGSLVLDGVTERPECPDEAALLAHSVLSEEMTDKRVKAAFGIQPYKSKHRVLPDCTHLSSHYRIDFAAPAQPADLAARAKAGLEETLALCPPESYWHAEDVTVHGHFGTQTDEIVCYDKWGWKYDKKDIPTKPARSYPRYFPGIDNHFNPEEDILDELLIMYLRTGKRPYLQNARTWANYWVNLYAWRTDGWRWKDGGVWWRRGPKGNSPQRPADPVTGIREFIPTQGANKRYNIIHHNRGGDAETLMDFTREFMEDNHFLVNSKGCFCHNWAQGLMHWYLLTGDSDARDAAMDRAEQDADFMLRVSEKSYADKNAQYAREFNRSCFNNHAVRYYLPEDPWVRESSDKLAALYLGRDPKEPRGLVNSSARKPLGKPLENYIGQAGLDAMKAAGVTFDAATGQFTDKAGHSWHPISQPALWMFPPQSAAMEIYYRITGSEDAMDWIIAYGQGAAHVMTQRHGNFDYSYFLVDAPLRGVAKDIASWSTDEKTNRWAEGPKVNSFMARFHPDVCARAYLLCGEPLLKQRAYDLLFGGTHRGYDAPKVMPLDQVGMWMNYISDHDGQLDYMLQTFYVWAHERADSRPPGAVADLKVSVAGESATVSFTAPADEGGKAARYQVKCSDRPIVDYQKFVESYNRFEDDKVCNWWMAANLAGEPAPGAPGAKESFVLKGIPTGAKHFAVCTFDGSSNRSPISNVAVAAR